MNIHHRKNAMAFVAVLLGWFSGISPAQIQPNPASDLPVRYEELTAPDFVRAVGQAEGVCVIPIGILEKHGPHLPLGTDLLTIRETVLRAARREYCVVFPEYYCGQIFEAKHQPGTIAYGTELQWKLLQETCDELGRNGFTRIILANGHGGNGAFLSYFCQAQLATRKPYSVVLFSPGPDTTLEKKLRALRKSTEGGHADEVESSTMMACRPELVHPERANLESGENLGRLDSILFAYVGIWWYARYPNHYAGDGSNANQEIGELVLHSKSAQLATLIKALKADKTIKILEDNFFDASDHPLRTKQ
jgi:creatinine amidohydrolase